MWTASSNGERTTEEARDSEKEGRNRMTAGASDEPSSNAGLTRTTRLLLREYQPDDWPAVLAYHRDPHFLRFYLPQVGTEEWVRAIVDRFIEWQREEPRTRIQLAVTLPSGELIGSCGIRRTAPDSDEADIGYELATEHWGRGYATELACALLRFGFEIWGLQRISARCAAENTASARVLEKIGMLLEARLTDYDQLDGGGDELLYGITEAEWRSTSPNRSACGDGASARPAT